MRHAPPDYACPFCALVAGEPRPGLHSTPGDVIYRDATVLAFVASHWWPRNPGHVLIVPTAHYENLYTLPDPVGAAVAALCRRVALAMKHAYACPGVSTRQHNEPAGHQDVWHYHLHVFPRYPDDGLYPADGQKRLTTPDERRPYAERLRSALSAPPPVGP